MALDESVLSLQCFFLLKIFVSVSAISINPDILLYNPEGVGSNRAGGEQITSSYYYYYSCESCK